jgi:hypothetical protein
MAENNTFFEIFMDNNLKPGYLKKIIGVPRKNKKGEGFLNPIFSFLAL